MSIQAVASVLEADVGEVSAKMLLVCLANAHNTTTGLCCPSIDRLAAESGMGRSTVKRWLKWLAEHSFIVIVDRHDTTGRQQAHEYRLTLGEGSNLDRSPQDVVGSDLDHRGSDAEPVEGSTVEPPLKKPEEEPSPQPPSGGLSFASLLKVWPLEHQGNRENAEGAWNKMGAKAQASAVGLAETAAAAIAARGDRVPALVMYLRNRVFEEFEGAPPLDSEGRFVIKPGMPEWNEWMGWIRKTYGDAAAERTVMLGSFLPKARWPEKARAA